MYDLQTTIDRVNGLLQEQSREKQALNEYCHISKNTINSSIDSKYGLGASILYSISDYLNCTVDYLLGKSDIPKAPPSDLSDEEMLLIKIYRTLSPKEQGIIFGEAKAFSIAHDIEANKKEA